MGSSAAPRHFGGQGTFRTMTKACALVGLDAADAVLMRLGENALYSLSSARVVVRIARSLDMLPDVRKEVEIARWLREADFPAVRLANVAEMPVIVDGHPVTFWHLVDVAEPRPSPADLGRLLRRLHSLEIPEWLRLPDFQPFARVAHRLANAPEPVATEDLALLQRWLDALRDEFEDLRFQFPPGPVHGDAHRGNLLRAATGDVVLIDFEQFCYGPREWDLSLSALYRYSLEWFTEDEYRAFVAAYGYDIGGWAGLSVLQGIRELGMTTWLLQMVGQDAAKAEEFARRMVDIRQDRLPRRWRAF